MLVISRQFNEWVVIRDHRGDIVCSFQFRRGASDNQIRIAFDAPQHIEINRREVDEVKYKRPVRAGEDAGHESPG